MERTMEERPSLEKVLPKRYFSREISGGKTMQYAVQLYPQKERIQLLNAEDNEIGYLSFSIDSRNPEKFRVQDMRITNLQEHSNNLAIEMYEELLSYVKEKNLTGIKSDDVVYMGAVALWKKLSDKGYSLNVHPDAQNEYDAFCEKYSNRDKYNNQDMRLSAKGGASVFEISV